MPAFPIIKVKNLCKTVSNGAKPLHILQDISLCITTGESIAIVGASGSGKSTLLAIMAGLDLPDSGEVRLNGQILGELDEDNRAILRQSTVGFVFQSFYLLPTLTAFENTLLPLELAGMQKPQAEKIAAQWLSRVGLHERMKHYPKYLSGGEQQRVALARAFAPAPSVIFADEPTGNLDTTTSTQIIDLIFQINQEQNTTIVLVTHDEKIASRCTRMLHMDQGKLTNLPTSRIKHRKTTMNTEAST